MSDLTGHFVPRIVCGAAALAGVLMSSAPAQVATSGGEVVWLHQAGPGVENWNSRVVSLGNNATQVFSTFGAFNDFSRLFSAFDQNPPSPVWQATSNTQTMRHRVASARAAAAHVAMYDVDAGGQFNTRDVIVKKHSSGGATPDWSYTFPDETNGHDSTAVHVSDDGQVIVALMHNIWVNRADIAVFGPNSGTPISFTQVDTLNPFKQSLLSADGRTLMIRSGLKVVLFDTQTATVRHSAFLFGGQVQSDALAGDGSRYAIGTNNDVRVWSRDASGAYVESHVFPQETDSYCARMAISEDASRIVMGYNYWNGWLQVRFRAYDLASGTMTMDAVRIGSGSLQNLVSAIDISADGSTMAVGLWGDEGDLVPEISVYDTNQNTPISTFTMSGSVTAVSLSEDGKRVVAAAKNGHANVVGTGGKIALFDIGNRDFKMTGVPTPGSTVTFHYSGAPGKRASLLTSFSLASSPIDLGPVGTMYLDPINTTFSPMGWTDAAGHATASVTLPNSASMIGTTLYFQGFASPERHLSEDWLTVTVLP